MSMINGTSSSSSHIIVRPEHIMNCEFSHWFPIYKDVSFKSHIIELPNQFLLWLKADGVSLPPDTPTSIFCATNDDSDSDDNDGDDISQTSSSTSTFQFDELNRQVQEAIESLGGHAFPKTNWSAPQVHILILFLILHLIFTYKYEQSIAYTSFDFCALYICALLNMNMYI